MNLDATAKKAIQDVIIRREGANRVLAQIKEDIKAIAENLGVKPAQINKVISLVEKERGKGGVLEGERNIIDAAEDMAVY